MLVYNVGHSITPQRSSHLLQFDVFSFNPELEAVATSFHTDLWQAMHMHTPKTSLTAMSADEQAVAAMQQRTVMLLQA